MQLIGNKKDFEELITEIEDLIADREKMLDSCKARLNQVQSGLFDKFGEEYVEKRIHEENDLINRIVTQIGTNKRFLKELKESFEKQFN